MIMFSKKKGLIINVGLKFAVSSHRDKGNADKACLKHLRPLPCPVRSRTLLTLPSPAKMSIAYLPLFLSVGSLIFSHSWSSVTPHCTLSEYEILPSLNGHKNENESEDTVGATND